jgi:NAD(P)-dependent dehydrogenase (short-subunit alcohol dehydrogenase family)
MRHAIAALPYMAAQRYGKIILTTSVSGLVGLRGQATYAAAQCAVVGLMRILAIEGAEHGILVNTISPIAYTRMHPAAGPAWLKQMEKPPCRLRLLRQRSSGWQAMVVRRRTASTTWEPEQSNASLSSWVLPDRNPALGLKPQIHMADPRPPTFTVSHVPWGRIHGCR